jgi:hypothetical protein
MVTSARDRVRVSSLTAGLAVTLGAWTFLEAFSPSTVEALGEYSPWLYGPVSTLAWAFFSGIAYAVLRRSHGRDITDAVSTYRCPDLAIRAGVPGISICASLEEKRRLEAVTAGFALTIGAWITTLSFMPQDLFDSLTAAPAWVYCLISVALWMTFSAAMHLVFGASDRRSYPSKT